MALARGILGSIAIVAVTGITATLALAQTGDWRRSLPECCHLSKVPGVVYVGGRSEMTIDELAAYAAPILWFSSDEPSLEGRSGADIRNPSAFPFESAPDRPVV
jgi:hypothetical protein